MGLGIDEFGYKLWDDKNRKIIKIRDVVFNKRVMYKDKHKNV